MNEAVKSEILGLRKKIIEKEFDTLNEMQRRAALTVKGPLLVIAGAGSGKTTVLVNRTAHILRWGEAYESDDLYGTYSEEDIEAMKLAAAGEQKLSDELAERMSVSRVYPWRILAITFTNKAANELKDRICRRVGTQGNDIWAATFHSVCTRILRRYSEYIGYSSHFTIYDSDDQKRLMKDCIKSLHIDEKMIPVKSALSEISYAKNHMINTAEFRKQAGSDQRLMSISDIYDLYQQRLLNSDAMDFDDIIFNTVLLFKDCPDILEKYSEQFQYIMVDEYQDTNKIQYELVRMLAERYKNICVVGDDDQSIYKFRGAMAANILEFDTNYENTRVIKLEQNYRSTKTILTAANHIIKNNTERRDKTLWTKNETGNKIVHYTARDEGDEGRFIAEEIKRLVSGGLSYADCAVLYRMNSQSLVLERILVRAGIPYRIIGGHRFFDRREIKDMTAYLNVISNHHDNSRLKRIINIPKRGIGDKTVLTVEEISNTIGQSMFEVMEHSDEYEALVKSSDKLKEFCRMIRSLSDMLENGTPVSEMYEKLIELIDYEDFIKKSADRNDSAIENIHELTSGIARYEEEAGDDAQLQSYLEEISLLTDVDSYQEEEEKIVLMTLHSAKGLEFPVVFIPGMEENIFPGFQSTFSPDDMEEERRLAYVGITRAKQRLYLLNAETRMLFGHTSRNRASRFIGELPGQIMEEKKREFVRDPQIDKIPAPRAVRLSDIQHSKVISGTSSSVVKTNFAAGMRVSHANFGEGIILSVKPMASDKMLEIAFDSVGTKKLMASFAKLKVI